MRKLLQKLAWSSFLLLLAGCASQAPQVQVVASAARPPPQLIPVPTPCVALRDVPSVPPSAVTQDAIDRTNAAIKALLQGTPADDQAAQYFTDIIDLFYLLNLDLSRLQLYAINADAALRGCVSDLPAAPQVKDSK